MSYLPRMSKTYKEPEQLIIKEPEENFSPGTLKPASSILSEKVNNPQTILKHYRYHPHPLPVLPGPSILEEVTENELYKEASRIRRSASKMESMTKASEIIEKELTVNQIEETVLEKIVSRFEGSMKRPQSRKGIKKSKSSLGKRKSGKYLKMENVPKSAINTVNVSLVKTETPFMNSQDECNLDNLEKNSNENLTFLTKNDEALKFDKFSSSISSLVKSPKATKNLMELLKQEKLEDGQPMEGICKTTQCAIVENFSKFFVIPSAMNSLLQTLSFLLHEIDRDTSSSCSKEKKIILTQIQSLLDKFCNERVEKEYGFDITYSDFKRLEKILGELKKYMKDTYGDKSECVDKIKNLKKSFIELRKNEMELFDLSEKLEEMNNMPKDIVLKEKDLKNPEVTLQNNRLESEQLTAEVEFSLIELRNQQKIVAELDWDIKNIQKQLASLKKSVSYIPKTENSGKKNKFFSESLPKGSKSIESEVNSKKKT